MNKYLEFIETENTGKTKAFLVRSKHGEAGLGYIRWYGPWRQYTFYPWQNTVWNPECLRTIIEFIDGLMEKRRIERGMRRG